MYGNIVCKIKYIHSVLEVKCLDFQNIRTLIITSIRLIRFGDCCILTNSAWVPFSKSISEVQIDKNGYTLFFTRNKLISV